MDEDRDAIETLGRHRRVLLNALAQLVPGGATFVTLYNAYIPTRTEERQRRLIESWGRKLADLGQRFEESRVLTEPFADLFDDVMATVATRRGSEKREYYASVLAKALTADAPEWDRQERMVACLDALRPSHIRLLAIAVRDLGDSPTSVSIVGLRTGFSVVLPEDEELEMVEADWRDMVSWGIFKGLENHGMVGPAAQTNAIRYQGSSSPNFFGTILPFGLDFADFVNADDVGGS